MSFEAAQLAFDDLFAVVREDRRQDYGEDRYILLGMVQDRLLAISHAQCGAQHHIDHLPKNSSPWRNIAALGVAAEELIA
jgi:uncharacterized DUF497 family protein